MQEANDKDWDTTVQEINDRKRGIVLYLGTPVGPKLSTAMLLVCKCCGRLYPTKFDLGLN